MTYKLRLLGLHIGQMTAKEDEQDVKTGKMYLRSET